MTATAKTQEEYNESEIGLLPKEWSISRLGDVCNLVMGQSPAGETYNKDGKGMPFLQGKAEFGAVYPEHIKFTTHPLKIAKKGSVLLSVRAPVGDVNIANIDYCIGRGLASLSMNNEDNRFLFFLLTYFKSAIEREGSGSTFKAISKPNLKTITLPFPPLPEQHKIAFVLSTVQDAQESTELAINSLRELKKSLMKHLFTYGAVSFEDTDKVKLKETEIGKVPEGWEIVKLGDCADFKNGINFSAEQKGNIGIATIDVLNMYGRGLTVNLLNLYKINKRIDEGYLLKDADILFVRSSLIREGVGWATLFKKSKDPITFCGFIIRARLKSQKINPEFLTNYLRTDFARENLISFSGKVAITNINQGMLGRLLVPIPTLPEQQQIVSTLTTIDEKIEAQEQKKEALTALFNSLLKNLMTAKIRVKDLKVQ